MSNMLRQLAALYSLLFCSLIMAEPYYWQYGEVDPSYERFSSPEEICSVAYERLGASKYVPAYPSQSNPESMWICEWWASPHAVEDYIPLYRVGTGCDMGEVYDPKTAECVPQLGPPDPNKCEDPSSSKGNPIDIATGNKFQVEYDIATKKPAGGLELARYYNSVSGRWTHSYSSRLIDDGWRLTVIHANGAQAHFNRDPEDGGVSSTYTGVDELVKNGSTWVYRSMDNKVYKFDLAGRLHTIEGSRTGEVITIDRDALVLTISSSLGGEITLEEDQYQQPINISSQDVNIEYQYSDGYLASVTWHRGGQQTSKQYHYEKPGKPRLLTGITDERGVRYATWDYDSQDRANLSQHTGGDGKVFLVFNSDGSTTVRNALDKETIYRFQTISGARRITSIEGQPSANCPNSNSTFTYHSNGLLKTKTDNKGNVTEYEYDHRGLEISRIEAYGTAVSRAIITEWHPTYFLPEVITEPDRITTYQYDDAGKQLSRTIEER